MPRSETAAMALAILVTLAAPRAEAASCESLTSLKLADTLVTASEQVAPGALAASSPAIVPAGRTRLFAALPAFCRVSATLTPSHDSDIKIEIWLPLQRPEGAPGGTAWNGRFQ